MNRQSKLNKISFLSAILALLPSVALAEGGETALIVTGTFTAIVAILVFFVVFVLNGKIDSLVAFASRVWSYVVAKPQHEVRLMDEQFDGITELDNNVPPWFNYLFGATVIFAAAYFVNYHVVGGSPLSAEEYQQEVAAADVARRVRIAGEGSINEDALVALADEESVKTGKEKFQKNCISCHGAMGQGIVGPNLTDQYWINGGGIKNVFTTIKNGVPAKGMISWKLVFTPKEIQQIASYVLTLQGTNPPGAKKSEGTIWVEPKAVAKDSTKVTAKSS
jgi:cytochrome c oxidase cbb3-type subunit 3